MIDLGEKQDGEEVRGDVESNRHDILGHLVSHMNIHQTGYTDQRLYREQRDVAQLVGPAWHHEEKHYGDQFEDRDVRVEHAGPVHHLGEPGVLGKEPLDHNLNFLH